MKEIIAIIRPGKERALRRALLKEGFLSWQTQQVFGKGHQKPKRYLFFTGKGKGKSGYIPYVPKKMMTFFVQEEKVNALLQLIFKVCFTGKSGDGRIFVLPLDQAGITLLPAACSL